MNNSNYMNFKASLYSEILLIADALCNDGIDRSWEILFKNNAYTNSNNCDIYSGASGVVLFLLELYEENKEEKYLERALQGLEWITKNYFSDNTLTKSFYTGSLGIVFVFYKAFKITNNPNVARNAEKIFDYYLTQEDEVNPSVDIINGIAGEIVGLLHIHSFTKKNDVLNLINKRVGELIKQPIVLSSGIAWENSIFYQKPLCGFSHGAAGIGWIFLELGNYFQNDSFFWLAEQTFSYEDSCFNQELNNWPDYRAPLREHEYEKHYLDIKLGDLSFFTKPDFFNAWCHGASGIGLSRLRAFEILKDGKYMKSAIDAINCTIDSDVNDTRCSFELCHGNTGNADLFIEASRFDNKFNEYANAVALKFFKYKETKEYSYRIKGDVWGEDISLFRGDTGIAYFFLRLYNNSKTPSVLLPKIDFSHISDISNYENLNMNLFEIRFEILEKILPKTIYFITNRIPNTNVLNEYFLLNNTNSIEIFYLFVKERFSQNNEFLDILEYEYTLNHFYNDNLNHGLWHVKICLREKQVRGFNFSKDFLNNVKLWFPEEILLIKTRLDWNNFITNNEISRAPDHSVYLFESIGLRKIKINEFNYLLLKEIQDHPRITFKELSKKMQSEIDEESLDIVKIESFISEQVFEFIKVGIINFEES